MWLVIGVIVVVIVLLLINKKEKFGASHCDCDNYNDLKPLDEFGGYFELRDADSCKKCTGRCKICDFRIAGKGLVSRCVPYSEMCVAHK